MYTAASVFPHFLFWLQLSFLRVQEQSKACLLLHLLREVVKSSEQTIVFVASKHHVDFLREVCHDLHCVECVCFCVVMVVLMVIMIMMIIYCIHRIIGRFLHTHVHTLILNTLQLCEFK